MADKRKPCILNVDDNDARRYAVTRILRKEGFDVAKAATGEEALRRAEERPDLVLLDVNLPDLNGFEVCERIKANPQTAHIPVVHLSSTFMGSEDRTRGLEHGADGYLTQPVEPQELVATIKAFLRIKAAEEALRESEERYRSLFENMLEGFAYCRMIFAEGRPQDLLYLAVNKAFEKLTGLSDVVGRRITEVIPGIKEANPELLEIYGRVALTGKPERFEDYFEPLKAWLSISVYSPAKGYFVAVFDNITERKRTEEERKALERQLHRSAKMEAIGTLAGGIAHDFNNIMAIVLGNAELALDNVPEWNPAKDFLKEIRAASLRAKDLTRQILAFSRHSIWNRQPVRISPIISDSLKFMRAGIPATVEIRQRISCERDVVLADPVQINQVLMNLCANASHAMKESVGILEVSLENVELDKRSVAPHQDLNPGIYVKLSVRDTGHGIDPKDMDLLFDPYFTTKAVGEGSGLGLCVVQGIVKIIGGAIRVESEVGKGSFFEVLLPCIEGEEEVQAETTDELLPTGTERILLVDDESGLVKAYAIELGSLGYPVVPCTSALEALELFKAKVGEIDLVITDLTMPGMTGKMLARELMRVRPDIPIILCTGYDVPVSAERTREMGVSASLIKPISKGDLANTIRKVLDGH